MFSINLFIAIEDTEKMNEEILWNVGNTGCSTLSTSYVKPFAINTYCTNYSLSMFFYFLSISISFTNDQITLATSERKEERRWKWWWSSIYFLLCFHFIDSLLFGEMHLQSLFSFSSTFLSWFCLTSPQSSSIFSCAFLLILSTSLSVPMKRE